MIYCANCGTSNQKGSRFCVECGEPLPSTGVRCPMCDAVNPVASAYCRACNARLRPNSDADEGESREEHGQRGADSPSAGAASPEEAQQRQGKPADEPDESPAGDWLDELRESAERDPDDVPASEPAHTEEPFVDTDVSDWLDDLEPESEELQPPSEPESSDEVEASKDRELAETGERSRTGPKDDSEPLDDMDPDLEDKRTDLESAEIPDWLRDLGPLTESRPPFTEEEEPAAPEQPGEKRAEGPHGPPATIEIPEWLQEGRAGPPPDADEEAPAPDDRAEVDTPPESMQGRNEAVSKSEEESSAVPPPFTGPPAKDLEAPGWLVDLLRSSQVDDSDVEAPPTEENISADVSAEVEDADLEHGEVPSWIRALGLDRSEDETVTGPLEASGPLKGLRGMVPRSSIAGSSAELPGIKARALDEASLAKAQLLESLLGPQTAKAKSPTREDETRAAGLAERGLVASVLILSVLGMLLASLITGRRSYLTRPVISAGADDLYHIVDGLGEDDHVLVAFDYGPAEGDELNAAAQAVLTHVLDRGAAVSIVSTRPDGPLVAETLMGRIAPSRAQYTLVGYRPGTATAVSQLVAAADRQATLILVLTSRPLPLRLWIEQVQAQYEGRLPLVAVGSAALEPVTSPYHDGRASQLQGAIYGLKGGASYEALQGVTGNAAQRLDALAAGHIAIIALILTGAVFHAIGGREREPE